MRTKDQASPKKGASKKASPKKTVGKLTKVKPAVPVNVQPVNVAQAAVAPMPALLQAQILPEMEKSLAASYMALRQTIGALGASLPFIVSLGAWIIFGQGQQSSISAYYYTGMRDVLVGMLCATGFFLYSYKGYARADEIAGKLCFVFALGVAFFPTTPSTGPISDTAKIVGYLHLFFAAGFFLTLSYFCLILFVKTNATPQNPMTIRKVYRNRIYRACGIIMVVCIVLMAAYSLAGWDKTSLAALNPTYWLEAIAILAFGVSWLTKGEAILKDES